MIEPSSLRVAVDQKVEVGMYLCGIAIAVPTFYYTGQTGNWEPLMAISVILSLLVLFITS